MFLISFIAVLAAASAAWLRTMSRVTRDALPQAQLRQLLDAGAVAAPHLLEQGVSEQTLALPAELDGSGAKLIVHVDRSTPGQPAAQVEASLGAWRQRMDMRWRLKQGGRSLEDVTLGLPQRVDQASLPEPSMGQTSTTRPS
ncbi:MAG: hypothetical protein IT440_05225 [Phycisphaeraceae bacterium]|nr:hypothetical protein [Phycisphaeraceae bacterium]